MAFDAPVLAFDEPIARELVIDGGIIFTSREDLARIAALAKVIADDEQLRRTIVAAQRAVLARYVDAPAIERLKRWLDDA